MAKRKKKGKTVKTLHILQPDAAGIDIGATEIYIAVAEDRAKESISPNFSSSSFLRR